MAKPEQKYALVSGASSGIGYQLAIALSNKGYKVFGCAPEANMWEMKPLTEEYGVVAFACDITNVEDVKKAAKLVGEQTGGRLDILYNNAGIGIGGPAVEIPDEDVEKVFRVNVFGHIYMTKYMVDYVIAAKGKIVYTASVAARVPLSWMGAYCATKAAIEQYARVLQGEMKPFGVSVHSVITGGVNTGLLDPINVTSYAESRYNVDGFYESMASLAGMSVNPRTSISAKKYAEQVVGKITGRCSFTGFNIYKGSLAYTLHLMSKLFPFWLLQWGMGFHFRLLRVWKLLRKQQKTKKKNI